MAEKREIAVSVRMLVNYVSRSGDLESSFVGSTRMLEGIKAHIKIQNARPDGYLKEVAISHILEREDFTLIISGRMDGLYLTEEIPVIDEIKSTYKDPSWFKDNENKKHISQVKVYAYLYCLENNLDKIGTKLTYYNLITEDIKEYDKIHTFEELETFFNDLVKEYLRWQSLVSEFKTTRDNSIEALDFPFKTYRKGQRDMAVNVYLAIKNKRELLVRAPTGIGKTMASIFPAVKALKDGFAHKIFYLTARTTGRSVADKALKVLSEKGLNIKSVVLTAKEKICLNDEVTCNPDECIYARSYYDKSGEALKEIFERDSFGREIIVELAEKYEICPFEFSLDISLWADLIICDYNYVFAPNVYLRRFFDEDAEDYCFLIDEAHNLTERARDMYSSDISDYDFQRCMEETNGEEKKIEKSLRKIINWFGENEIFANLDDFDSVKTYPDGLNALLRRFIKVSDDFLSKNIKTNYSETILDLYFKVSAFLRIADSFDDCYTTCYENGNLMKKLKLYCIDPSSQLSEALKRGSSSVFFSATLSPFVYFKVVFGLDDSCYQLNLESPFPEENLKVIILDQIPTTYRKRENSKIDLSEALSKISDHSKGNQLFFFPSYSYMEMIHEIFGLKNPERETLLQEYNMSETMREKYIDKFDDDSTISGFAVMGGVFGEGIDLIGDKLNTVAITGVGLPAITPDREIIKDYFEEKLGKGFEYAYIYPGINRVLQAAGRVIRTENDRGVVILIDERFSRYPYRNLLNKEWKPQKVRKIEALNGILYDFWN